MTGARLILLWAIAAVLWWGFAFWPTGLGDDSWIAAAQAACFGSRPGGAPAAQGWMMLTLAPLMLLATIVVAYRADLAGLAPRLARSTAWRLTALLIVCVFGVEVTWAASRLAADRRRASVSFASGIDEPLPPDYPRADTAVPAFRLVDQTGAAIDAESLQGRTTIVGFVFAHCRTVCPAIVTSIKQAVARLTPGQADVLLVTLDPWRDTPAALPALADFLRLPPNARLVSGPPEDVNRVLDAFDVARQRNLQSGDVAHVPLVVIVDRRGFVTYRFNNPPPDWIVEGVGRADAGS